MNEDEKMFHIGIIMLVIMGIITVALQVCYRVQNDARKNVRREIVQTEQEIAVAKANFASYVRPEILRNLVSNVIPRAEVISFHKTIDINDLPTKTESK